jgi:hypothetical protein
MGSADGSVKRTTVKPVGRGVGTIVFSGNRGGLSDVAEGLAVAVMVNVGVTVVVGVAVAVGVSVWVAV